MPLRCLQCEYALDGLQPEHDAVVCPECGMRQVPGTDRDEREHERDASFTMASAAPWGVALALVFIVGWIGTDWTLGTIGLAMLIAPCASALLAVIALVRHRHPRITVYQWTVYYPIVWCFITLVGFILFLILSSALHFGTSP